MTTPCRHWSIPDPMTGMPSTMTAPSLPAPRSPIDVHCTDPGAILVYNMENITAFTQGPVTWRHNDILVMPIIKYDEVHGDRVYLIIIFDFFV